MPDRRVIYDPELEVGAIIDMDENRAIGPISVGPNAAGELQSFIDRMPEEVFHAMNSYELVTAYMQFWNANFSAFYQAPETADTDTVGTVADGGANDAALAERTATAGASEPPAPGPADADMEADQGEVRQVAQDATGGAQAGAEGNGQPSTELVACFACSGSGSVPGAAEGSVNVCNLCSGTGKVTRTVPA